jgi:hypothetical protein
MQHNTAPSFVYLVEAHNGNIKIGCAAKPAARLAAIRTHSPLMARLIAVWPGCYADEQALHQQYRDCRSHCEWFEVRGEFAEFVAEKRGTGLERVEEWHEIAYQSAEDKVARTSRLRSAAHKARWADPQYRREHVINRRILFAIKRRREQWLNNGRKGPVPDWLGTREEIEDQIAREYDREVLAASQTSPTTSETLQ